MKNINQILRFSILLLIFVLFVNSPLHSQRRTSSLEGRHFHVGFMQNEITVDAGTQYLKLFISATADAKITITPISKVPITYTIKQDSMLVVDVSPNTEVRTSEVVKQNLVEINSDVNITLYAFNSHDVTTDSYAILPVSQWGQEYVVLSLPNDQYDVRDGMTDAEKAWNGEPRSSEFMLMADYDSTEIYFSPRAVTRGGKQVGTPYTVTLNKGECYLVQSYRAQRGEADLTGTIVRGNKPFGLLSGHVRTAIPQFIASPWNSKNHLCEMLIPTRSWGQNYISIPFGVSDNGDFIRITSIKENTLITYDNEDGSNSIFLGAAGSDAQVFFVNSPTVWTASQPIQMGQFMMHSGASGDNVNYDPCFVVLPPIEQYVNKILFEIPRNPDNRDNQFIGHYVYIVSEDLALPTLTLNDKKLTKIPTIKFNSILGTNLYWARFELNSGRYELRSDTGNFSGVIFGFGYADAYAMTMGCCLTNPFKKDSLKPVVKFENHCDTLIGIVYEPLDSNTTGLEQIYVVTKETYNFTWKIDTVTDTSTVVSFTAMPVDLSRKGKFVFIAIDKNGNSTQFEYTYDSLLLSIPTEIDFGEISWTDSSCVSVKIKNTGAKATVIQALTITGDNRAKIKTSLSMPYTIKSGDSLSVTVCFEPKGNIEDLFAVLNILTECDRTYTVALKGSVIAIDIIPIGFDFGDVLVGDTVCAEIMLVNNGNIEVIVDSLYFIDNTLYMFEFFDEGIFPYKLLPKDTLKIKVCFTPYELQYYSLRFNFVNKLGVTLIESVTGNGVAPDIESVTIDWGKRRVGTKNDTTAKFLNRGTYSTLFSFDKFNDKPLSNAFDTLNIKQIKTTASISETLSVPLSFIPDDMKDFNLSANFKTEWRLHKDISLILKGQGTIPVIKASDPDFDTVFIYTSNAKSFDVISSEGNEILTVDEIIPKSGDINSFIIDYTALKNLKIEQGEKYPIPITFEPKRIGLHKMTLEIVNDAAPNYERIRTEFTVTGFAIPYDTVKAEISLKAKDSILACRKDTFELSIENTGNVPLTLQELTVVPGDFDVKLIGSFNLPLTINVGKSIDFKYTVFGTANEAGKIVFNAKLNDSLLLKAEKYFKTYINKIIINTLPTIEAKVSDSLNIEVSGLFPNSIEIPTDFQVVFKFNQSNLFLLASSGSLEIIDGSSTKNYAVDLMQNSSEVEIKLKEKIEIKNKNAEWKIKLPFLVLFNFDSDKNININAVSEECFVGSEMLLPLVIKEVCANPLRFVEKIDNALTCNIFPNPTQKELNCELFLASDETVNFSIIDRLGKKNPLFSKLYLKKGNHCFIFEIWNLTNGIYFLEIETLFEKKNIMFIINK